MCLRILVSGVLLLVAAVSTSNAQGVHASLSPTTQYVGAGSGFDVDLVVTTSGSTFNGFKGVVRYDPAKLTFVPTSPTTLQQGSYMTGACGSTFHLFSQTGDSLNVTDVLLCNGVSLSGPGQVYRFHFVAANTPGDSTIIRIEQLAFYDAGVRVTPVFTQDDTVYIDNPVGVGDVGGPTATIELRAAPNPSRSGTTLLLSAPVAGEQSLLLQDVAGRVVRHLGAGRYEAGPRAVAWDGRDDRGSAVAPGVYLVRYVTPAGSRQARVVVVR
jgi:hypothetical protein